MAQEYSSGTVSKILWHFTGGPNWDVKKNRQYTELKKYDEAFEILKAIVKSGQLRLSKYQEIVHVNVPKYITVRRGEKKKLLGYEDNIIKASPICCLADIPIQHLSYHAKRYGKFAIGFHRNAAIRNGFNPVFYTMDNSNVINSIYSGMLSFDWLNFNELDGKFEKLIDDVESGGIFDKHFDYDEELSLKLQDYKSDFDLAKIEFEYAIDETKRSIGDFVAFIKSFNEEQFGSIYCEREWRSVKPFNFNKNDIAMIVLPRKTGHYKTFIKENFAPRIPVVPWEDLIES